MSPLEASRSAAVERVRRLLATARSVAAEPDLVPSLVASSGLSAEGVKLALARCLEKDATDAEVTALVAGASSAAHVHVILSANVFTAALRALAVAWAAAETISVRPSGRDPGLAVALVRSLADARVTLTDAMDPERVAHGEIHVYGRDETVAAVVRRARPAVRVRGHGAGLGVAFVHAGTDLARAAGAIADDVVVFDQRGCLSPRVVLVEGDAARARNLAEALGASLSVLARTVPRGRLDEAERRAAARYVETMAFAGHVFSGNEYAVGTALGPGAVLVPPVGRHVHVLPVADAVEARACLAIVAPFVVAIGCDDEGKARALAVDPGRVRRSRLGSMQRPPFDGPVDLRLLAR